VTGFEKLGRLGNAFVTLEPGLLNRHQCTARCCSKLQLAWTILAVGPSLVSPQHHQAESCRMSAQFPPDDRTGQFSINFFRCSRVRWTFKPWILQWLALILKAQPCLWILAITLRAVRQWARTSQ